jgi:zinc-ribbon domain
MPGVNDWRFCPYCGTECVPEQRFCSSCGKPLAMPLPDSPIGDAVVTPEETAGIFLEMTDMEAFLRHCAETPDEALLKISRFLKVNPDAEETCMILIFRVFALAAKAKLVYESNGNTFAPNVFEYCKSCLDDFKKARKAAAADNRSHMVAGLEGCIDEVACLLEKHIPGKVQGLLGETKLKFLACSDRLGLHKSLAGRLPNADLRDIGELFVTAPFTIRYAYFASLSDVGSQALVYIMLFETSDLWGANDQMNPIKGTLSVTKTGPDGGNWKVEKLS